MAAAAYAAVVSVMNLVDRLNKYTVHPIFYDSKQMEYLREKVVFLQEFLERHSQEESEQVRALDTQIRDAAYEAEDVIESHVVDQLNNGSTPNWEDNLPFLRDLEKVIQEMDSIEKIARVIQERSILKQDHQQPKKYRKPAVSSSRARPASEKKIMVGFENERKKIMEWLTDRYSSRDQRVIPIVGMGGIGKTTLAKDLFVDSLIREHFDVRIWVTVSQEYTFRDILLQFPACQENQHLESEELGVELHKSLYNRRYLVILDDVWTREAWGEVESFLPNDATSRIILTTRQWDVANHFGSCAVRMRFLDWHESWKMFCEYAFAQDVCPRALEIIAREVVGKCKGLPLSVAVIGAVLATSPRTEEYWGNIAKDINSILSSEDYEYCLNVLSLSYKYLPIHLKPCFLYMGVFPEDHHIRDYHLHRLWVSEGFLKSNDENQTLEMVAEGYIKDLVDRNLISLNHIEESHDYYAHTTCQIHDLLRDLCQRVAEKEGFYCVIRKHDLPRNMHWERRLTFPQRNNLKKEPSSHVLHAMETTSLARTLICASFRTSEPRCRCRLLRVLYEVEVVSPEDIFQQVNLQHATFRCRMPFLELPSSISLLWNLQTLHCKQDVQVSAPSEFWEMQQLRHIHMPKFYLPDPPSQVDGQDLLVLENLQSLVRVVDFKCSEEVLKRMPNIKILDIDFLYNDFLGKDETSSDYYCLLNLCHLQKLEVLGINFNARPSRIELIQKLTFPSSLNILTLENSTLFWDDVSMIGMLPHLTELHLECVIEGQEWNTVAGQFHSLKFLYVDTCCDLIKWNADQSHFPVLQQLQLHVVPNLEELPSDIGYIPTLKSIKLAHCKATAAISAMEILDERESCGDDDLTINVGFMSREELELFDARLKSEGKESISNQFKVMRYFTAIW